MKTNSMPLLLTSIAAFAMATTGYSQSPPQVTVRLGQAVYWTTEGNDTVWLTVERGNGVEQEPFTVEYATSELMAKAGWTMRSRRTNIQATSRPATQASTETIGVRTVVQKGRLHEN